MVLNLSFGTHEGSAPEPFDALNGVRLAGLQGSHPLHGVRPEDLLRQGSGAITGEIVLDRPARIGDGMTGTIRLTANERVAARAANLRLVGLRLDEERKSREDHDSKGNVTNREEWVEAQGTLFIEDGFVEPVIPTTLEAGATWEGTFSIPAPPLGPPTAHLGEAIIAWALEVRWDVARASDHFVALYLPVAQNPDLIRAGVGKQGGVSMLEAVSIGDASIGVTSPMPVPTGSEMVVRVAWPSAPGGKNARIELHRRTNAPNGSEGIVASVVVPPALLAGGEARLAIPAGVAPSFDGAGLEINYVIRVLVDVRFRPDAAIERPVAIL